MSSDFVPPSRRSQPPPHRGARLGDLARELGATVRGGGEGPEPVVSGVRQDSREVERGDLFVARRGRTVDGAAFVAEAVARGAAAVLAEPGTIARPLEVPLLEVEDASVALAYASAIVHGHPTFSMDVVGITGTNGKTTTATLVRRIVAASGGRPGIVGTLGYEFEGLARPATHTSPEADELARIAGAMRERGATHLVMEVSSIALAARRVEAVRFRVAAFTNLTQDHLDYHGSMEAYAAAKARLFDELGPGAVALNVDDPFGRELSARISSGTRRVRVSSRVGAAPSEADLAPLTLRMGPGGIEARLRTPAGEVELRAPLVGAHNVDNLLLSLAIAHLLDLELPRAAASLAETTAVPGRLERCDEPALGDDVIVLVDYAHTPDALERVLSTVRALTSGRILCVFGCGGDRDRGKRPLMGEAVARGADVAILTSDNPRTEDPGAIADEVRPGLAGAAEVHVELDRAAAIRLAVRLAHPGDVVLVAGKGHETYQIVGERRTHFDDRDEARAALAARRRRP